MNQALPTRCLQDTAWDVEGEEAQPDEEWPPPTALRRASAGASPVIGRDATPEEVAHFGAAKERKHLVAAGIAAFNRWVLGCQL